jgi:hypothetical protein
MGRFSARSMGDRSQQANNFHRRFRELVKRVEQKMEKEALWAMA